MNKHGVSYVGDSQIMPAVTVKIPMPKGAAAPKAQPEPPFAQSAPMNEK
jgi:hypothetical protein